MHADFRAAATALGPAPSAAWGDVVAAEEDDDATAVTG